MFKFCCGEREVNRKMLTPTFEKYPENSGDTESETWAGS